MLKKFGIVICIVSVIASCGGVAYGDFEEVLKEHWAKDIVDEKFVERNFPHLIDMGSKDFNPDSNMTTKDFTEALERFISSYDSVGHKVGLDKKLEEKTIDNNGSEGDQESKVILRKDAVEIIANLLDSKPQGQSTEIPFKDIEGLEKRYIEAITKVHDYGVIKGSFEKGFEPEKPVTQVQAIIMLQRFEEIIKDNIKVMTFKVTNKESTNSGQEGIGVKKTDDKVLVTITQALPNPGYDIEVENVKRILKGRYKIYLKTKTPDPDKIYPQVITYKTITFEIDKNLLDNEYKFDLNTFGDSQINTNKF
ncbi:S-layer homology domain-containing protein [Wukongibacter baidiensis]|uniref:protease complex subunit PrcB family protein n=1 Tax=Wukongibacter baidiensis TaxID=1723361 RepID=UPI003D7FA37B